MILLAHHEASPTLIAALITFAGPAIFAFRCWLWSRRDDQERSQG